MLCVYIYTMSCEEKIKIMREKLPHQRNQVKKMISFVKWKMVECLECRQNTKEKKRVEFEIDVDTIESTI